MENGLKPYEYYKYTQIIWANRIPEHWDTKRAKALYNKATRSVREYDEVVTCFRDGTVTLRKKRRTTGFTESIKEVGYQGIRKGDLVIHVMDAFAGAVGVSDSDGKGTPVYSVCIPKVKLNNNYFAYVVREMAKTGFIQSLYRGIRERSSDFRFDVFAAQVLPVPPLEEQNQIVKYLDSQLLKINKFIKAKKKLIATLKEQKQAVINQAVTKGIDPDVKMKPSGIEWLGTIPQHWSKEKITRLFKVIGSGTTPKSGDLKYYDGDIQWINSGDLKDAHLYDTKRKVTKIALSDHSILKVYPKHTIVIAMYGATIGKLAISRIDACCNQACCCLSEVNSNRINLQYAFYLLYSCRNKLIEKSKGGGQPNISQDTIKSTWLPVPPVEEQERILSHIMEQIDRIDKSLFIIEKEVSLILEYRTRLISDVVTGKVDVRGLVVEDVNVDILDLEDTELEELESEELAQLEESEV
ncbi:restriction endonuclease subunit S [Paenibacillus chungangensis]|uniref:Restriction endonuclease subunit S n=1 Tax=Paenibacillus chungangensis TaxID=696535 RepID=A0ABW3HSX0_9BACL